MLVLTTSNVTGAIDLAFVDRADIKQYIGPPNQAAIYSIYYSCIQELQRQGFSSSFRKWRRGRCLFAGISSLLYCFGLICPLASLFLNYCSTLLVEFPSEVRQSIGTFSLLCGDIRKKFRNIIFVTKFYEDV